MRLLLCISILFSSTAFAFTPSPPDRINSALDRLEVVFTSARTPHVSLWRTAVWGGLSGAAVYSGLVLWTGHHSLASKIFNYALAGSFFWGIADSIVLDHIDKSIARKARLPYEYMNREVLPDFFRLSRDRQLILVRESPELANFLLRLDAAIQETAPVTLDPPVATPRTS